MFSEEGAGSGEWGGAKPPAQYRFLNTPGVFGALEVVSDSRALDGEKLARCVRIKCGGACVSIELRKLARASVVAPESLGTLWPSEAMQRLQMAGDTFPKAALVQESLRALTGLCVDS